MIYKEISGRLGNQMFQYAAIRSIYEKSKYKDGLILNFEKGVYQRNFENELKYFNIMPYHETDRFHLSLAGKLVLNCFLLTEKVITMYCLLLKKNMEFVKYCYEKKMSKILNKFGIYVARQGYISFDNFKCDDKYVLGYFESSLYFDDIKEIIVKEFTPKQNKRVSNKKLYEYIENNESVCVTIRRGDFVENEEFKKNHYICTPDYFVDSMKFIQNMIPDAKFIVFSDDIEWCKKNISFPGEVRFESGKDPVWEKLRLMYSCKHFIISNSTFSWWAQYLSQNDKKIVVAPNKWRNTGYSKDIYMDNWILYDVDKRCMVGDINEKD